MAIVGISKGEMFPYVSDSDPCKTWQDAPVDPNDLSKGTKRQEVIADGATKFTLVPLDVFLMGMIYDRSSSLIVDDKEGTAGLTTKVNATAIDAVRFGLKAWENFKDAAGNDIQLTFVKKMVLGREYQAVTDESLTTLGIRLVQELGEKIKSSSNVSPAEVKNSAAA